MKPCHVCGGPKEPGSSASKHGMCKSCYNESLRVYRLDNLGKIRNKESRNTKARVERYWQAILEAYGRKCYCCGETREDFLTLSHLNNDGGKHRRMRRSAKLVFLDVVREGFPKDKYGVACMNCNFATRWGRVCPHEREKRSAQAAD